MILVSKKISFIPNKAKDQKPCKHDPEPPSCQQAYGVLNSLRHESHEHPPMRVNQNPQQGATKEK